MEMLINSSIQKHLSTSDLLSDRQYGFCKGRSTFDFLSLLTDSWPSSLSRFGKTFSVALDISKAFDRVRHNTLFSYLPSFAFYPSLCSYLSSFLSGRSISTVIDGHCSSHKPINSGVPQGSVLSPTLLLLFISDLLTVTKYPIHSYADALAFTPKFSLPAIASMKMKFANGVLQEPERVIGHVHFTLEPPTTTKTATPNSNIVKHIYPTVSPI